MSEIANAVEEASPSQSGGLADNVARYPPAQSFSPIFVTKVPKAVVEKAANAAHARREAFLRDCMRRNSMGVETARRDAQVLAEKQSVQASADDYAWRTAKANIARGQAEFASAYDFDFA